MPLVVFLRGVNVGGHRRFRPSVLAKELADHDVVNVGTAGTFVVRRPITRSALRAALVRKLPFETTVVICDGRDVVRIAAANPFETELTGPDIVRFVSVLSKRGRPRVPLPIALPSDGEWLVRVVGWDGQFVFGEYRRAMKTIGDLGRIDELFGASATTRNWNTIRSIVRILNG
jgi:uncharacterized protein (DUF1697 family)